MRLEDLKPQAQIAGIIHDSSVAIIDVRWYGQDAVEVTYKAESGSVSNLILYREDERRLELVGSGRSWDFSGDGHRFRLAAEAERIRLAYLFDPYLAVHSSAIEPLPHQITAVYEEMIPRQPLRFLLADDPGAGKTIMSGLLIKELMARGDVERCLIVSPGSLAEQWQDELSSKFSLDFEVLTNDKIEASRSGNYFSEAQLVIARLDKLSRSEDAQAMLSAPGVTWDLVIFDEAHKLSATVFGGEVKYTKRYRLGQLLASRTRNLLLLTATPHNGKEEDFQLFLALLDQDRFEGRFRDGARSVDTSDLMRRAIKEQLLRFDGTPLFPERIAESLSYRLSDEETALYGSVTNYVRDEFNRADALDNKRRGTVGFALTILQRRLASSPEAIYQSLKRRKERLQSKARELELLQRAAVLPVFESGVLFDDDELDDLEDAGDTDFSDDDSEVIDQATAAMTIAELNAEIDTLDRLERMANSVRVAGRDTKWRELSELLGRLFTPDATNTTSQKLVIFTEHRDTLRYLQDRISSYLGKPEAVVVIHGGLGRQERAKIQESFSFDPATKVLVATDAAGEGINLQRAHLMVNYDLPWNPNRLEQRFGRIHRIGQKEVCYLWNLVASETREGDVYQLLLAKLNEARHALGGQVFDVLGKLSFGGKPLRELLLEAIRYSELPEVRARLTTIVEDALDVSHLKELIADRALVAETLDSTTITRIKEDMERAETRRLQPSYIRSFFIDAFTGLGGKIFERETGRYEITYVPASIRSRDRLIGRREPVLTRYERVVFDKSLIAPLNQAQAAFLAPGHPLLVSVIDLILEQDRGLLSKGTVLVDETDGSSEPRILVAISHTLRDGTLVGAQSYRVIDRRLTYVELGENLTPQHISYAPYLDYRPLREDEPNLESLLVRSECAWINPELSEMITGYAVSDVVPKALGEVRKQRLPLIEKTSAAVKERLVKEINYWEHRANVLDEDERIGKPNAKLNSNEARRRAEDLTARLRIRLAELERQKEISPLPPTIIGAVLVVPLGLIRTMAEPDLTDETDRADMSQQTTADRQAIAARAREIVMERERSLGNVPIDKEFERLGYDIESFCPSSNSLRFLEVKGRAADAETITVTKNEVLFSLNNPDGYILAIISFHQDGSATQTYLRAPFRSEPDFAATSVNYSLEELLSAGIVDGS